MDCIAGTRGHFSAGRNRFSTMASHSPRKPAAMTRDVVNGEYRLVSAGSPRSIFRKTARRMNFVTITAFSMPNAVRNPPAAPTEARPKPIAKVSRSATAKSVPSTNWPSRYTMAVALMKIQLRNRKGDLGVRPSAQR